MLDSQGWKQEESVVQRYRFHTEGSKTDTTTWLKATFRWSKLDAPVGTSAKAVPRTPPADATQGQDLPTAPDAGMHVSSHSLTPTTGMEFPALGADWVGDLAE